MTPEQRAEKLMLVISGLLNITAFSRKDNENYAASVKEIAAQIAEAEKEAVEQAFKSDKVLGKISQILTENAYQKGRASMRREVMKQARGWGFF